MPKSILIVEDSAETASFSRFVSLVTADSHPRSYVGFSDPAVPPQRNPGPMQFVSSVRTWLGKSGIYVSRERPYTLNWQVRALFEQTRVNCVIDVGAHFGEYGRFLRNAVGYTSLVDCERLT